MMLSFLLTLLLATPLPHSSDLYVAGFFDSSVQRFLGPRSAAPGAAGGTYARPVCRRPWGIAFGPDGALWVANLFSSPAIARVSGPFSATPGAVETIVDSGGFYDLAFGPDGNLYAAGAGGVRRYDVVTHALIDDFAHGYALTEARGLAFGPDGNLYVSNYDSCVSGPTGCTGFKGEIVRFDGVTGAFIDVYVANGQGGLRAPWKLAFNARGELLVANWFSGDGNILRFPASRAHRSEFITRPGLVPLYFAIGPDQNVYVSDSESSDGGPVLRFDGKSGAFIDVFVPAVAGGPRGLAFAPGAH